MDPNAMSCEAKEHSWRRVVWLWVLPLLAGCISPRATAPLDLSGPDWTIRQGQAVWQANADAAGVAGDLLVATHPDGSSLIQFVKPPLPFVSAQRTSNDWRVEFAAQKEAYSGRGRPPNQIVWLHLTEALAEGHSGRDWSLAQRPEGYFHFENLGTKESLDGFLTTTQLPATHLVRAADTLPRIARWYGISGESIQSVNPGSASEWFKPGATIRLPVLKGAGVVPP